MTCDAGGRQPGPVTAADVTRYAACHYEAAPYRIGRHLRGVEVPVAHREGKAPLRIACNVRAASWPSPWSALIIAHLATLDRGSCGGLRGSYRRDGPVQRRLYMRQIGATSAIPRLPTIKLSSWPTMVQACQRRLLKKHLRSSSLRQHQARFGASVFSSALRTSTIRRSVT